MKPETYFQSELLDTLHKAYKLVNTLGNDTQDQVQAGSAEPCKGAGATLAELRRMVRRASGLHAQQSAAARTTKKALKQAHRAEVVARWKERQAQDPAPLCACGLHPQNSDGYCPAEQTARESHSSGEA